MKFLYFLLIIYFLFPQVSKAQSDTIINKLEGVEILEKTYSSYLKGSISETLKLDMKLMHSLPKILGNADPLRYAQMLPGIQTCSEYTTGLYIQGSDNSHNIISIDGVTVYNASHLLGLFSTFNPSHFSSFSLTKSSHKSGFGNRLGGEANIEFSDSVDKRINGTYTIGLISSQGTINIPLSQKFAFKISMRTSYLNLFYGSLLKSDEGEFDYYFQDYNATMLWIPDSRNTITVNSYFGSDIFEVEGDDLSSQTSMNWSNALGNIKWKFNNSRIKTENQFYFTSYINNMKFDLGEYKGAVPSSINDFGYRGNIKFKNIIFGADAIYHHLKPQHIKLEGDLSSSGENRQINQESCELSLYTNLTQQLGSKWSANIGLRANNYILKENSLYSLDPSFTLYFAPNAKNEFTFHYGTLHQYLFRAGFSQVGLPTEFWFSSNNEFRPQYAHSFSLSWTKMFMDGTLELTTEVYYKRLYNQVEYKNNIIDLLTSKYTLGEALVKGSGENYGLNIMLHKRTGNLTGWLSYSLGRAMRRFPDLKATGSFPASHERVHEFNAVATYRINKKWDVGATMILASGTPFTAPKYFYMVGGNLISEFEPYNSKRLDLYFRVDISANYTITDTEKLKQGINFSLYNVNWHKNDLFYRLKIYKEQFGYRGVTFLVNILPSISYFRTF